MSSPESACTSNIVLLSVSETVRRAHTPCVIAVLLLSSRPPFLPPFSTDLHAACRATRSALPPASSSFTFWAAVPWCTMSWQRRQSCFMFTWKAVKRLDLYRKIAFLLPLNKYLDALWISLHFFFTASCCKSLRVCFNTRHSLWIINGTSTAFIKLTK